MRPTACSSAPLAAEARHPTWWVAQPARSEAATSPEPRGAERRGRLTLSVGAASASFAAVLRRGRRRARAARAALGGESQDYASVMFDQLTREAREASLPDLRRDQSQRRPWKRPKRRRPAGTFEFGLDSLLAASPESAEERRMALLTANRVIFPTLVAFVGGAVLYSPFCRLLQDALDSGNSGSGPLLTLLGMDQSQFMQNFLTVNGLLFTILCGNTYTALYNQNERLYHALFMEVSEAKSLLEQACLVCQGRPFYPRVLSSIGEYVENDLRRLDVEPSVLLARRPMEDPLEYILYATSVGVPSIIYDTVRDLRQARGVRLGAMQRKLPAVHFVLLYVLGLLELLAFPFLGAGNVSMAPVTQNDGEPSILLIQGIFFGAMSGAIVMTLQIIFELWDPYRGAYTVDTVLQKMVQGLEEELLARRRFSTTASAPPLAPGAQATLEMAPAQPARPAPEAAPAAAPPAEAASDEAQEKHASDANAGASSGGSRTGGVLSWLRTAPARAKQYFSGEQSQW